MKKILPALLLISASFNLSSQSFTLTQTSNEPAIGDSSIAYLIDTSAYSSGLNMAMTGSNTVWTYTDLVTTSNQQISEYLDPSAVPASTNYPGCTIVQKQGPSYNYYKSVSSPFTQLEFMGMSTSSLTMNFTNTAIYARYPFAFGDQVTDNFSGSFTFSLSGSATGNATITADGTGTLHLPNDTLTDVLRIKSVQTTTLNAGFINGSVKWTIYSFYHASQKFPVFSVNYQSVSAGGSPTITAVVTGNKNNFVVGLMKNFTEVTNSSVYPNPTKDVLNIEIDQLLKPEQVRIYDQLGRQVFVSGFEKQIDVKSLTAGIYFIEVKTKNGVSRKKFIKE